MSAFKQLRDISIDFQQQIHDSCNVLFSAQVCEPYEDMIAKKMKDLTFMNAKLRLLKAKPVASTPAVTDEVYSENTIKDYGDTVSWKVLEQAIVKSLTQAHAVTNQITAPGHSLNPESVRRKEKIIQSLKEYRDMETQLRHLQTLQQEKEEQLAAVREEWDNELSRLRDLQEEATQFEECETSGPLYKNLRTVVDKLEMMRWLVCRLVTSRGSRDWLASPEQTARALRLARTQNTVHTFVDG